MPTSRERLVGWARPDGILLPEERGRRSEFVDLFVEQLRLVSVDPERPTIVERYAARARAAHLWAYDRLADDGAIMRERVRQAPARQLARAEHFAESDLKSRLAHLLFDQLHDTETMLEHGRRAVTSDAGAEVDNVVALPKRRRK